MLRLVSLFLMTFVNSTHSEKLPYEAAYQKAQQEEKVLLVVVGAEWCVACQSLKESTLEPMQVSGKLDCVVMTQVDKDDQPELAKQVMNGSTLPQLVAFKRTGAGWKRFSLSGNQSQGRVEELIRTATDAIKSQVPVTP